MKKSTKKRLLIAGIVFAVLVIGGVVAFNVAVNKMFSKVTQTISDSDLLKDNGSVELPVVTEGNDAGPAENLKIKLDAETMKRLESKISVSDKFAVLSLLAKALPSEEYSRLLSFAKDGISQEELTQAMQILQENLTDENKEQIKQYYSKYLHLLEE
ncbi:hypothetical protein [Congzhengia minquanensis]|uniref:Uncharacterized protein n=1 Tax=Congzhengia minquanensis TaxID=2763657 RepID=A0A926DPF4_9FIRM|nr:hypothetical protein [Congzhengia minquanensis]MBC8541663.1 hypothetical protein [Congzhengia minquanensis]